MKEGEGTEGRGIDSSFHSPLSRQFRQSPQSPLETICPLPPSLFY